MLCVPFFRFQAPRSVFVFWSEILGTDRNAFCWPCFSRALSARLASSPLRILGARLGARDCTPEINSSEIIVDFQWHFPMDGEWHVPTDFHVSEVFSEGLSLVLWILTGIVRWTFSGIFQRFVTLRDLVWNIAAGPPDRGGHGGDGRRASELLARSRRPLRGDHANHPQPHPDKLSRFIRQLSALICYIIRYFKFDVSEGGGWGWFVWSPLRINSPSLAGHADADCGGVP